MGDLLRRVAALVSLALTSALSPVDFGSVAEHLRVEADRHGDVAVEVALTEPAAATAGFVRSIPAPASAPEPPDQVLGVVVEDAPTRGARSLARLPLQPSDVGFTISFHGPDAGYGGLMWPDRRHIEIFVDPGWSDAHLDHVVAHEIGHALDLTRNSRADHDRWRAARGFPPGDPWWATPYLSDFASPSGDFAECFAAWAVGSPSRSHAGGCDGTQALIAELVAG